MPRPSQHTDRLLLDAARGFIEETGCSGLNLRKVAEKAQVNLGMFHYHFKTKDAFCRRLLDGVYEDFFKELTLESGSRDSPLDNLRAALLVFGRFARDNRRLVFALMRDAMADTAVVQEFLHANLPRHLGLIMRLVRQCQRQGQLRRMPLANATVTLMIGAAMPSVLAEGLRRQTLPEDGRAFLRVLDTQLLSDTALAQRIDVLIAGLAAGTSGARVKRTRGSKK